MNHFDAVILAFELCCIAWLLLFVFIKLSLILEELRKK